MKRFRLKEYFVTDRFYCNLLLRESEKNCFIYRNVNKNSLKSHVFIYENDFVNFKVPLMENFNIVLLFYLSVLLSLTSLLA